MKRLKITSKKKSYRRVSLSKKRTRTRLAFLAIPVFVWCLLFAFNVVTIGGVPASIIGQFLSDRLSVTAFFLRDGKTLHNRLEALGVEEEIKDYYRPQIPDEIELDQYIHQILFNSTGYVGNNYRLNSQGMLVLKDSGKRRLQREIEKNSK